MQLKRKGKERKGKERKGKERKGKERKGKERKGKGLLYLIAIAVLISIVFIACKKKPTGMNDFVPEAPEVEGATQPTPAEDSAITPPSGGQKANWNTCTSIAQLYNAGYTYFVSSDRQANGTFKYTLEIKNNQNEIAFTGKDADGNNIDWSGELGMQGSQTYHVPGTTISLTYKLTDRGIINFRANNMNTYIKLYLSTKP